MLGVSSMKISETKHNHIDEGPLDFLSKSNRDQKKAFKSGQKTLKLTSDNLKKEFAQYLGQKGVRDYKKATGQDLKAFLDDKDVDVNLYNIPNGILQPAQIDKIMIDASKDAIQGKGVKPLPQQNAKSLPKDLETKLKALTTAQRQELLSKL